MMIYVLLSICLFVFVVSFFEERLKRYNLTIYILLGIFLILYAGLKEVGFDNDSEHYDYFYLKYDDSIVESYVETSYVILSKFFNNFTSDVHIMFFLYSGVGIILKMCAIRKLSELWFLPMLIYIGSYYIIHDMTQIRACVVSGLFLMAIKPLAEGEKKKAALLLILGCIFHYSAIVLLPALLFNNNEIRKEDRLLWALIVPVGYIFCLTRINLSNIPIPYIGDKLANYQELTEKGIIGEGVIIFRAGFVISWLVYLYVIYFYDTIIQHNKYLPLMIRLIGVSVFSYLFFSFLSVLAIRISELYRVVEIFIIFNIYYTIKQGWVGKTTVGIIGLFLFFFNVFIAELLHS